MSRPQGRRVRGGESDGDSAGDWRDECEKYRRRLDELTRRTNEHNNYINSVFSSMEDGFFLADTDGGIVLYNQSAENLLDIHGACFFGEGFVEGDKVMGPILESCRRVRDSGAVESFDVKNRDGRDLQVRVSPVRSKYGDRGLIGMLAIVKDVTEIRKVEAVRKEFVANVSHEFRTPLTLIAGFIEMLRMYDNLSAEDRNRSLEILEIETERLKRLISELLLLSKMENKIYSGDSGPANPETVVAQVTRVLAPLAQKKLQRLETRIQLDGMMLEGDETWLFQAIHNIVENAIKYTPEGGSIRIEAVAENGNFILHVSDDGIGIARDELARIFERFYRVDKSRGSGTGGSGLGLAIAKDIVSLFNGSIEVSSELGVGSTFTMRIPSRS